MSNFLNSGSILPSGLMGNDMQSMYSAFAKTFQNYALRVGVVTAHYSATNDKNISKLTDEYDVLVFEQDENRGLAPIQYKNCISSVPFGSKADFFEARHRAIKKKKNTKKRDINEHDGALVLLLCLDGSGNKGIIVGALPHPDRKTQLKGEDPQMVGEYNGIKIQIESDGSAKLTFKGATDNEGMPKDKEQGETIIDIEKDGTFQVKNKGTTQRAQKDGKYSLITEDNIDISTKKNYSLNAADKVKISAIDGKLTQDVTDFILKATGSASIEAKSVKANIQGEIKISTQMLNIEAASMAKIKATNITLDGLVQAGGPGGTPALILSTSFLGTGNEGAPVISQAIGPFSTKVFIA